MALYESVVDKVWICLMQGAVAPFGCVLAVQSKCTLCVGHSAVMDSCLWSAMLWKLFLKYLSNIGTVLKAEMKCTHMLVFRAQTCTRTSAPHPKHHLYLFSVSLWCGYVTLYKARNCKALRGLNHCSHFKDMCCQSFWSWKNHAATIWQSLLGQDFYL